MSTDGTRGDLDSDDFDSFAIAAARDGQKWVVTPLPDAALDSLAAAETALREVRNEGAVVGVLNVLGEYLVLLRVGPSGTRLVLSDATAALDDDLAADVLERLNVELPDLSDEELEDIDPWSEGEIDILADLGIPAEVLQVLLEDPDAWADEQAAEIAERLGFAAELEKILDSRD